jgi:hypothetical protein
MAVSILVFVMILSNGAMGGEWTPKSRFWRHLQEKQAGLIIPQESEDTEQEEDQWDNIQYCLDEAKKNQASFTSSTRQNPVPEIVSQVVDPHDHIPILFEIESALTQQQAMDVKDLASCIGKYIPYFYEHRNLSYSGNETGGNDCTFLNPMLQLFLPEIASTVQRTAELAYEYERTNWKDHSLTPPGECGLRTSEYLDYRRFKTLGEHDDRGSIYTVLYALSDPSEYEGGQYFILDSDDTKHFFKPKQYSALVFLSEKTHGVSEIESGHRRMFTNEYWILDDPPWPETNRPKNEHMEIFVEKCDVKSEQEPLENCLDVEFPSDKEAKEWLTENGREDELDPDYYGNSNGEFDEEGEDGEDDDGEFDEEDEEFDEEDEDGGTMDEL